MNPAAHFHDVVRRPVVPLGEGCCAIAQQLGHPVPLAEGLGLLEQLADEVRASIARTGAAVDLASIARVLFDELGFDGDGDRYYDARNSLLPAVIRRRRGIPITLAIVVIEVADRSDVTATGVGMPGHFLVGDGASPDRWLDGFAGGRWLDATDAEARFHEIHGPSARFDDTFLLPTPRPQILARVLANLAGIYRNLGDPTALLRTLELRCDIPGVGATPRSRVELAEAYVAVGRVDAAIDTLEDLAEHVDPRRRDALAGRLAVLRSGLN